MKKEIITDLDKLRTVCEPITWLDDTTDDVASIIKDMKDTLESEKTGVGLAAPQIGVNKRIILVKPTVKKGFRPEPVIAMINPIYRGGDETVVGKESCLSVPGVSGYVRRWKSVTVTYDTMRDRVERWYIGREAIIIQHECDHLDGVEFTDKLEVENA